jgi:hypothetical protein
MCICDDINRNIKDFMMILSSNQPISFENWYFRITESAQQNIEKALTIILKTYYKTNKIKIKSTNGYYDAYISNHIAYAIISKMINPDYKFIILSNIPVDTIFYSKPVLDSASVSNFISTFYIFPNVVINPETKNKVEHELLDKKIETLILKTIETINMNEIIQLCHNNYMNLTANNQEEKERLFRENIV